MNISYLKMFWKFRTYVDDWMMGIYYLYTHARASSSTSSSTMQQQCARVSCRAPPPPGQRGFCRLYLLHLFISLLVVCGIMWHVCEVSMMWGFNRDTFIPINRKLTPPIILGRHSQSFLVTNYLDLIDSDICIPVVISTRTPIIKKQATSNKK